MFCGMEVNHYVQITLQGRGLHKDVYTGVGDRREPLRGEGEDPCRVSALPRIKDW